MEAMLLQIAAVRSGIIVFIEKVSNDKAALNHPKASTKAMSWLHFHRRP
jgi:hypothetical protein